MSRDSRASGPCSTKTRLKFHQLEEKKDDRVTADPLHPWERIFSSSVETILATGPISAVPGPSLKCGTSSFNFRHTDCNVGWKRPKENPCLFKTGCHTQQNRTGLPTVRERKAKKLTQKDGYSNGYPDRVSGRLPFWLADQPKKQPSTWASTWIRNLGIFFAETLRRTILGRILAILMTKCQKYLISTWLTSCGLWNSTLWRSIWKLKDDEINIDGKNNTAQCKAHRVPSVCFKSENKKHPLLKKSENTLLCFHYVSRNSF